MNMLRGMKCRWGDTCWGLISRDSNHRQCGCNSGGWQGFGIYYGGYKKNNDGCGGQGGGFSGPKTNGQAKGNLASVGLTIKISALANTKTSMVAMTPKSKCQPPHVSPAYSSHHHPAVWLHAHAPQQLRKQTMLCVAPSRKRMCVRPKTTSVAFSSMTI